MADKASFASFPHNSVGRLFTEATSEIRGPRNIFQRDRDRIIHSISFRRLRHKTQVFIAPDGDHYRVRLTHSLEVAQIGRTIARALNLDEDLTEALCLAHDIGHPPFGHAGEDALNEALEPFGGFDHNAQTLRNLMIIENPYPLWRGLNLSWELLEGLAKHNGPVSDPSWALKELDEMANFCLMTWPSLEAQVAAVADDIAYDNHDIDDGIRAGLLSIEQLCELPFIQSRWDQINQQYAGHDKGQLISELIRQQIGVMVNDVIEATQTRLRESSIETVDDVRNAGFMIGGFSEKMAEQERQLKNFMYANLYHHKAQLSQANKAHDIIAKLYAAYDKEPEKMPEDWLKKLPESQPQKARHICDFIAGMTDRYAQNSYNLL